jgi:cation transport ATPase
MSGSTNAGDAFDLIASRRAAREHLCGTSFGWSRLRNARRAPMSRLADRLRVVFLGLTVVMPARHGFGAAIPFVPSPFSWWPHPVRSFWRYRSPSSPAVARAKHGVLIKGGKALESLAR